VSSQTKRTLKDRYHGLRERLAGDDDSDKLRQHKEQARHFLDENLPPERRDQFLWRLKKAVHESQQRDEYEEGPSSTAAAAEAGCMRGLTTLATLPFLKPSRRCST
jgi:truncated hemoglobin YjbI